MNQFDQMVGGGITSLLAQNQEVMGEPGGAFNFAPKNEPVLKMSDGGSAYSNEQLSQNIRDAIAQGKTFNDIVGSLSQSGVDPKQLNYVIGEMARSSSFTPQTSVGIPGSGGSFWTFLRDALKEGALTVGPMIVAPHLGAIGQGLGASAAYAPAVGGAVVGGTTAALSGKEGSDILKSAAIGALGASGNQLAGQYAKQAGDFAAGLFPESPDLSSLAKDVTSSAVKGAASALPSAIVTGDPGRVGIGALSGALTGGASSVANMAFGESGSPITEQQFTSGVNLFRSAKSGNMAGVINSAAGLVNSPDVNVAAKAILLLNAADKGNTAGVFAAAQQLGSAIEKSYFGSAVTKVAESSGGDFGTSAIVEPGDMSGTLVPGEGGESVNIFGTRSPDDIALDYFFSPQDTTGGQKVDVQSRAIKPESDISSVLTGEDLTTQRVGVEGSKFPIVGADDVTDLLDALNTTSTVPIEGKKIKPDELDNFINLMDKDLVDQRVDVTGKTIKPEDVTDQKVDVTSTKIPPETTKTTTTPATTPTVKPPAVVTKKPAAESPAFTPTTEAAPQQVFRPGVVTDAYEVLFGPGAPSMMGFTKAERAKQILARKREEEENQPETAYERLMSMADKDPVGTVDQLMKIIEGG